MPTMNLKRVARNEPKKPAKRVRSAATPVNVKIGKIERKPKKPPPPTPREESLARREAKAKHAAAKAEVEKRERTAQVDRVRAEEEAARLANPVVPARIPGIPVSEAENIPVP